MTLTLLILQIVTTLAVIFLLLRKSPPAAPDPRLAQLPEQLARLDARNEALDVHLRTQFAQLRTDVAQEAQRTRTENKAVDDQLRGIVVDQMNYITNRLSAFTTEVNAQHTTLRESLNAKLGDLMASNTSHQNQLRTTIEGRLDKLNTDNAAKLEEMRITVDEKLHTTLQTRLTESFGAVTDQLTKVHSGLGEMTKLSAGVDDLSRIFTNVKSRGTIGEVMLETLLKQMLAANQYVKNAKVNPHTQEMVEFAVKLPTPNGDALLPIDSKFPREAWERLESAYQTGNDILSARKIFETAIRNEGKKICEKYIAPPNTTAFAIMFLPTEGLYAEVMRTDGLQTEIQANCRVTIAGPSTLSAILSSFQMGFHMLQMQEKGDEVWKVLANARTQFGKFEDLMGKMGKDVEKVQTTLGDVAKRTRAINRTLRDVSDSTPQQSTLLELRDFTGLSLAAAAEDD